MATDAATVLLCHPHNLDRISRGVDCGVRARQQRTEALLLPTPRHGLMTERTSLAPGQGAHDVSAESANCRAANQDQGTVSGQPESPTTCRTAASSRSTIRWPASLDH